MMTRARQHFPARATSLHVQRFFPASFNARATRLHVETGVSQRCSYKAPPPHPLAKIPPQPLAGAGS